MWKYRIKKDFAHSKMSLEWQSCNDKAKSRIEKMYPKMYEFKEDKAPEPTPSMVKIDVEKESMSTETSIETKKSKTKKSKTI